MGANTLRCENPEMRGTNGKLSKHRTRAVISQSGNIPVSGKKLFGSSPVPVIFTAERCQSGLQDRLQDKARVIALPQSGCGLSLQAALDYFAGEGVESVLIEGGAVLNYSALAEGLVDEILLTLLPRISGKKGSPAVADGPDYLGNPFRELQLLSCEPISTGELFLHYSVM
jgi:riboflavin biosynthesis pyrimidine reductase